MRDSGHEPYMGWATDPSSPTNAFNTVKMTAELAEVVDCVPELSVSGQVTTRDQRACSFGCLLQRVQKGDLMETAMFFLALRFRGDFE